MSTGRYRRWLSAVGVTLLLSTGAVGLGPAPAAQAEPEHWRAVCAARACLVVLKAMYDRDGDGVADPDEQKLGTNPDDPADVPDARRLIDEMIDRKLPSFEQHLTEIVLLPTLTPDGQAIATGLGEFKIRDGDADLLKSIGVVIEELDRNGFESIFGLRLAGVQTADTMPKYPLDQPKMVNQVDSAWYSSGQHNDITSFGVNAGKPMTQVKFGNGIDGHISLNKDFVGKTETITYKDGSTDVVTSTSDKGSGTHEVKRDVTSYDKDGKKTGEVHSTGQKWTDDAGTKHTEVKYDKPIVDDKGKVVGTEHGKVHTEERKDGSTKVTTEITKEYKDGTKETTKTETECKGKCEPEEKKGYYDPEYIGFDVITPETWARVAIRIKMISLPVEDDGNTGGPIPQPPTSGQCWPACGGDSTLILMDPDGVVVIASDAQPVLNNVAMPDYPSLLDQLEHQTGQPVPPTSGTAPVNPGGQPTK